MAIIKKITDAKEQFLSIWDIIKPIRKTIYLLIFLISIITILGLVYPYIFKLIVDTLTDFVTGKITLSEFWTYLAIVVALTLILEILNVVLESYKSYYTSVYFVEIYNFFTKKTFKTLIDQDVALYENRSTGALLQKVGLGYRSLANTIDMLAGWVVPTIFTTVISTTVILAVDWKIGLLIFCSSLLYMKITLEFTNKIVPHQEINATFYENRGKLYVEGINNLQLLKSYCRERFEEKKIDKSSDLVLEKAKYIEKLNKQMVTITGIISKVTYILILVLCSSSIVGEHMTIGTLIMILTLAQIFFAKLENSGWTYSQISRQMVEVNRMIDILKIQRKIIDSPSAIDLKKVSGEIELKNVLFCYEENKKKCVLKDISLKIKPNEHIAIVGISGSGKSTLAKLLLRFYDVDKGAILIDGKDIREVTQKSLRENIAYVPQDPGIFNNTLSTNIKYGKLNATDKEVEEAAKQANIHDFIMKTPKGYKTIVGERGIKLSGGEKQRVAIARAFLKNAPILVLDEATSSLDSESEEKVQDAFWKLAKGKTTIIIAHRLSTVMKADKIVVIDKGRIAETGSHKELLKKKKGLYAKLFNIQSGAMLLE